DNYIYVDKTEFIVSLVNTKGYYFLSRPRRFGKSLLLSTLHAYFDGRRELFKGLAIDKADVDWSPSPVLHFDFNSGIFDQEKGLTILMNNQLTQYERKYGIEASSQTREDIPARFRDLITAAYHKTGQKVVILVDEYDKPLLGIEENKELFEKNQSLLKGFFGNLKSMDHYIRFAFLTGVARFNKVSIFSDLNNLNDISMTDKYADICGWTEQELTDNFMPGITELAHNRKEGVADTVNALREFYDGYIFAKKGNRLYNPFSVLLALYNSEIEPYWFETGTPTFLVKRVKNSAIDLKKISLESRTRDDLISVGIMAHDPVPLMFQTGYLTISSYNSIRQRYALRFPNRVVELGFAKNLLPLYAPQTRNSNSPFNLMNFQDDLYDGDPESFMKRLGTLLKEIPYEQHEETNYHNITYLLCLLSGTQGESERHSYKGRTDLEVRTPDYIYIFEFKYNDSVEEAMRQIHDRDYAGRYALDPRTL
ncbi:MAG: ATP-binding protein, partial [Muribaculaceae bacterium]|nr:ATP-binding protein [Muribaculaceae bacterium]